MSASSRPCYCFDTCSLASANAFLRALPESVTSAKSVWWPYLRAVYGDRVKLPFDMTSMTFFYHNDESWRELHADVEWPMASCRGPTEPVQPKAVMQIYEKAKAGWPGQAAWSSNLKEAGATWFRPESSLRKCPHEACSRWSAEAAPSASHRPRTALQLFVMPNVQTRNTRGTVVIDSDLAHERTPELLAQSHSWVEVMRMHTSDRAGEAGFEGTNGTGCWFFYARGSGIWLNTGRSIGALNQRALIKTIDEQLYNRSKGGEAAAQSLTHKERYPLQANLLGFDSVQMGGVGGAHAQLVATHQACMGQASPIKTCPPMPLRAGPIGWLRPCSCNDTEHVLNCHAATPATHSQRRAKPLAATTLLSIDRSTSRHQPTLSRQSEPPSPRAALILSGFLAGTCSFPGGKMPVSGGQGEAMTGVKALLQQVGWCREAFANRCDVFLHSWSTVRKARAFHVHGDGLTNYSKAFAAVNRTGEAPTGQDATPDQTQEPPSWPCIEKLSSLLPLTAASIETQLPPSPERLAAERPWGVFGENLINMRKQMASALGCLELMARHTSVSGVEYHAAVRLRADLGDRRWAGKAGVFIEPAGWRTVRRRADALVQGKLSTEGHIEIVTCGHPRVKHTDFCQWSVPPNPMRRMVETLNGPSFDDVVYGGEGCASFLSNASFPPAQAPSPLFPNGRTSKIPLFSENVLFCAMRAAGVKPSGIDDRRSHAF